MKKEDLRIVYMGTPDFAVESLRALVEGGYNVVGVITMPDKPMGRHGSVLQPSAVKQYAVSVGLPVLQPEKLKDEAFLEELRALRADLQIVVAFRMLPEVVCWLCWRDFWRRVPGGFPLLGAWCFSYWPVPLSPWPCGISISYPVRRVTRNVRISPLIPSWWSLAILS